MKILNKLPEEVSMELNEIEKMYEKEENEKEALSTAGTGHGCTLICC